MTVLSVVKDAATYLGLEIPSVLFTNTGRTWVEMQSVVNDCARQILDEYDWQRLKKVATITGDGVLTSFPLPTDYDRMVMGANLWGPNFTYYPTQQVTDFNRWIEIQSWAIDTWDQRWALFGGTLNILPALPSTETLTFGYISTSIVNGSQPEFTADTDTFTLDERLLKLCVIWNWKAKKGQDYAGDLQMYEDELARARFKDPGSRQAIRSGVGYRFPTGQSVV